MIHNIISERVPGNVTKTATIHDARRNPDVVELQTEERRSGVMKLKRSMSTPSLAKGSSCCQDSQLAKTTAAIHTGFNQLKETKSNPDLYGGYQDGSRYNRHALLRYGRIAEVIENG